MKNYVMQSLETHLFFGRIMKEHALSLLAAFPASETMYKGRADWLRAQFEETLAMAVRLSNGNVGNEVLESGEVVTEFTEMAERQTSNLTGIPIQTQITRAQHNLRAGCISEVNGRMVGQVRRLNQRNLRLLVLLIRLKEDILRDVGSCKLYTANYPLLVEHILREAKLYRDILMELEENGCISAKDRKETEQFWNRIMMEHAQFLRGLLDPTECELMETADHYAAEYKKLLGEAKRQDEKCHKEMIDFRDIREPKEMGRDSRELTKEYQQFKTAGTEGIVGCEIRSVILPLLADHVLREANHYLRVLDDKEGR